MRIVYDIDTLLPYINWAYYYHAWQVKDAAQQQHVRHEAETFLGTVATRYHAYALVRIEHAHAHGDDIMVRRSDSPAATASFAIPCLRQQQGDTCFCLADFISPDPHSSSLIDNTIGIFATSVDAGMEHDFDQDPYQKMMAQLLADRLAEAAAERLHEEVRKHLWGYAPAEDLSYEAMQQEHFQGIRPAVGYPSLPDASLNFVLDQLLDMQQIGIRLTESGAMRPHASVSGLMMAHSQARYFNLGKIGEDQLSDYARRRGLPLSVMRKFLAGNLC